MMKPRVRTICLTLLVLAFLAGCVTTPREIPAGLSVGELFQRAQEAVDAKDLDLAVRYYTLAKETYPDDVTHFVWASYEISFLYHKQDKNAEALALVNTLLDTYAGKWDTMPADTAAPRILSEKLKARLETLAASAVSH